MLPTRLITEQRELEKFMDYFKSKPLLSKYLRFYHAIKLDLENKLPFAKFQLYVKDTENAKYFYGIYIDEFYKNGQVDLV